MIHTLTLRKFKGFREQTIPLRESGVSLLAGGNNSGKSTVLHALAVWEYCRSITEAEKGFAALLPESRAQGLGVGDDEFSPILVPSLSHLWTNLKTQKAEDDLDGFTLRVGLKWSAQGVEKELEFGLALANDRLFVKATKSNLQDADALPSLAYLPPFAGITDRETRMPLAIRRRRIGEGLAGSVLRNVLLDLWNANQSKREELRGDRKKIRDSDLRTLRQTDSWELLQEAMRATFGAELVMHPFRDEYHSYIKVEVFKGKKRGFKIDRHQGFRNRDIMVEGSGFLQWLSVFALATDPSTTILLLDEPDSHLHSSLQATLVDRLSHIAEASNKQVLLATHSAEILRAADPEFILELSSKRHPRYLSDEQQKVGMLSGIGSDYLPRLDKIRETRSVFFTEGALDLRIVRAAANVLELRWPERWVSWVSSAGHKERKQLFAALKDEIPNLECVSLRDRDDESIQTVDEDLNDKAFANAPQGFVCKKWRRRHIESYLLWPPLLARASNYTEEQIIEGLRRDFAIAIDENYLLKTPPAALLDLNGKEVLKKLGIKAWDIVEHLSRETLPEDLVTLANFLCEEGE